MWCGSRREDGLSTHPIPESVSSTRGKRLSGPRPSQTACHVLDQQSQERPPSGGRAFAGSLWIAASVDPQCFYIARPSTEPVMECPPVARQAVGCGWAHGQPAAQSRGPETGVTSGFSVLDAKHRRCLNDRGRSSNTTIGVVEYRLVSSTWPPNSHKRINFSLGTVLANVLATRRVNP